MTEQIGKITLDLSKYPGEDLYCDGAVEDELLDIVKKYSQVEYPQLIEQRKSWPILYHLSPLRENIVDFVPLSPRDKVLEVGSGCGAITGALARKSGSVTCVDLSKKRSMINAYRHSGCDNITIHVGNFQDIEPGLPRDFNCICLIGVFEYGRGYIGGDHPYEEFLRILMGHLAPGGRILIAIENKYGLKYFAGCKEDHLGSYFSGIENYQEGSNARTFSRQGLEQIFQSCGVKEYHFYYPYPDYKFMTAIYSEKRQPGRGELSNNLRNFDRDRMVLFDEKLAFDGIVEEGLFSVFANSYMAVIGDPLPVQYVKYSNDRAREFRIRTEICQDSQGKTVVRKFPLTEEATEHVRRMAWACEKLTERYRGSGLSINRCRLAGQGNDLHAEFEYVAGRPLTELLDECLEKGDQEGFWRYFERYVELIGYRQEYPVTDFDLVFSNLLVDGDHWTLIDYEWTFEKSMESRELAFRAVYCYLLENEKRGRLDLDRVLKTLEITEEQAQEYRDRELKFQQYVEGRTASMAALRERIGRKLRDPKKLVQNQENYENLTRVQVYEDTGGGYTEDCSRFLEQGYEEDGHIELELEFPGNVQRMRIDPAMDCGICNIMELRFNGEQVPLNTSKVLTVNGKLIKSKAEDGSVYLTVIFPTSDPNISIDISRLQPGEVNILYIKLEYRQIPRQMAEDVSQAIKKWI
ncbi:MAG: methyltransferase domain-containing protein [Acetatifactor sp.]|nr:methyltransferase domain-containing protein [Acetatifactor sp.]